MCVPQILARYVATVFVRMQLDVWSMYSYVSALVVFFVITHYVHSSTINTVQYLYTT